MSPPTPRMPGSLGTRFWFRTPRPALAALISVRAIRGSAFRRTAPPTSCRSPSIRTCRTGRSGRTQCWSIVRPTAARHGAIRLRLIEEPAGQVLHDKNSLTADPTSSRFAYAVWDRLQDFTLPPGPIVARSSVAVARTAGGTGDGVVGSTSARATASQPGPPQQPALPEFSRSRRLRSSSKARSISPARPTSGRPGRRRASSTIPAATRRRSTT